MTRTFPLNPYFAGIHEYRNRINTNLMACVAMAVMLCVMIMTTGCTPAQKQTTMQIAVSVNAHLPSVVAAADTVAAVVASLDPASALIIQPADVAFDTLAKTVQALLTSYIANPTASVLQQIQTAINTLESTVNTAVLAAAGIKNSSSQALALAALKGLLTVVTIVFALISQTETVAMLKQLRDTNTIHLALMRPYMDKVVLDQAAADTGMDLNKSFEVAEAHGF